MHINNHNMNNNNYNNYHCSNGNNNHDDESDYDNRIVERAIKEAPTGMLIMLPMRIGEYETYSFVYIQQHVFVYARRRLWHSRAGTVYRYVPR